MGLCVTGGRGVVWARDGGGLNREDVMGGGRVEVGRGEDGRSESEDRGSES